MADLPHTLSFKAATWMRDRLRSLAASERRKVGDMIRILLERALAEDKERHGEL